MTVAQYYITTLTNAFEKIGPVVLFIILGYFLFIKLPFQLLLKNMQKNKFKDEGDFKLSDDIDWKKQNEVENKKDFQRRMRILGTPKPEAKTEERKEAKQEHRKDERRQESRSEHAQEKKEERRQEQRRAPAADLSAENIFELKAGQVYSKKELKKKYHNLIKKHHPDTVGPDLKNAAEKKTKEINSAYQKLKNKAA